MVAVRRVRWYQKSAQQAYGNAQYNLAASYAHATGIPQDFQQAAFWYHKAAEQGHALAQYSLGVSYYYGIGQQKNIIEAEKWLQQAAAQNEQQAIGLLKKIVKQKRKSF